MLQRASFRAVAGATAAFALISLSLAATTDRAVPEAVAQGGLTPPYGGTIFIDPDIITTEDPTTFVSATYTGIGARTMFDRRPADWITVDAYLFEAVFSNGYVIEVQVNPEFGSAGAGAVEANKYGAAIGRLPGFLLDDVETIWIHKGVEGFGGGNNNLLIHTGQGELYIQDGILEETFVHEATHTSLDATFASHPGWVAAQAEDGAFISDYARDNVTREDLAESVLPYLAVRFRAERISETDVALITATIPARMAFLDQSLPSNWFPIRGDALPARAVLPLVATAN